MTTMSDAETVRRVASEVGAMVPPAAVRAGYNIANLSLAFDADGENWTATILGPSDVSTPVRRYATHGGPPSARRAASRFSNQR